MVKGLRLSVSELSDSGPPQTRMPEAGRGGPGRKLRAGGPQGSFLGKEQTTFSREKKTRGRTIWATPTSADYVRASWE